MIAHNLSIYYVIFLQIMETTTDITIEQINKFLQPEITEIAVIKTKQKNERVSVQGSIVKVIHVLKKIILNFDNTHNIIL